jgi:hypothetical protein
MLLFVDRFRTTLNSKKGKYKGWLQPAHVITDWRPFKPDERSCLLNW